MRKYFITGLVILLPLALTLAIVVFFINLLTGPFVDFVGALFSHYNLFQGDLFFLSSAQVQLLFSRILILLFLFGFTVCLGLFARWVFFHYFIKIWDAFFHRIPFISAIYRTCQDVVKTIFTSETKSFKQVVIVPFPHKDSQSIGLVTCESLPDYTNQGGEKLVAVFVPTTPNPTSGFLMLFRPEDLIYLDLRIEEALKFIISCGVLQPTFVNEMKKGGSSDGVHTADGEVTR